jgi:DNA-binding MarR family transcriptional regulator
MVNEERGIRARVRKDVEAFMKSLGSTTSEIKVFMVLLKAKKYLGVKEIGEMINLSLKSIRMALKRLEEKGLVSVKEREGKKFYKSVSVKEVMELWKKKVENSLSYLFKRP